MDLGALKTIYQALESVGVRSHGTDTWAVPCKLCKRHRVLTSQQLPRMRVLRLLFCEDCQTRLSIAVVRVGPDAGEKIIT